MSFLDWVQFWKWKEKKNTKEKEKKVSVSLSIPLGVVKPSVREEHLWKEKKQREIENLVLDKPHTDVEYIILHHSLTSDKQTVDWNSIRKYHMSYRVDHHIVSQKDFKDSLQSNAGTLYQTPWFDIGYHLGVEMVNGDYMVQHGRPLIQRGAHTKDNGMNNKSLGICVIGNWDTDDVPRRQWLLTIMLIRKLQVVTNTINKNIIGHREAQALAGVPLDTRKTCPGKRFNMQKFRKNVGEYKYV